MRVLYPDVDQGGVVHHSAYVRYLETGRIEWLRQRGCSYASLERDQKIAMPVVEINVRYRKPMVFDDWFEVETTMTRVTAARMFFESKIYRWVKDGESELCTEAQVVLACIDLNGFKLRRFPEVFYGSS